MAGCSDETILERADVFIARKTTIRETAMYLNVPKSSLHYELTRILPKISASRHGKVRDILDENKRDAPRRGGEATKTKLKRLEN